MYREVLKGLIVFLLILRFEGIDEYFLVLVELRVIIHLISLWIHIWKLSKICRKLMPVTSSYPKWHSTALTNNTCISKKIKGELISKYRASMSFLKIRGKLMWSIRCQNVVFHLVRTIKDRVLSSGEKRSVVQNYVQDLKSTQNQKESGICQKNINLACA